MALKANDLVFHSWPCWCNTSQHCAYRIQMNWKTDILSSDNITAQSLIALPSFCISPYASLLLPQVFSQTFPTIILYSSCQIFPTIQPLIFHLKMFVSSASFRNYLPISLFTSTFLLFSFYIPEYLLIALWYSL